jgi:hypothetical protein
MTNDKGRFTLTEFVPADDQYGIQVAALKEGFAFQSAYQLKDKKPFARPDPIVLRLDRASPIVLIVRDGNGQPFRPTRRGIKRCAAGRSRKSSPCRSADS